MLIASNFLLWIMLALMAVAIIAFSRRISMLEDRVALLVVALRDQDSGAGDAIRHGRGDDAGNVVHIAAAQR